MQPVAKKIKSRKRKFLALGLVVLLLLAGLSAALLITNRQAPARPLAHQREESYVLIDKPEEDLLRMAVTSSDGAGFVLVREKGVFQVEGRPGYQLNEMDIALMVKDLTLLVASDLAGELPADEKDLIGLGLGPEAPRVTASYRDGSEITLIFGDSARTEVPSDFIMMAGDTKIYTTSPETRQHFDRALSTLHIIPRINFNSSLVSAIKVSGPESFTLKQQEAWWEITDPYLANANPVEMGKLLKSIGEMRLALYADEGSSESLADYGLDKPRRQVVFELVDSIITGFDEAGQAVDRQAVPAQSITIGIGKDYDKIGFYCLYDGKVYLCSNVSMGFLKNLSLAALRSDRPLAIPVNRLRSMLVEAGSEKKQYTFEYTESVLPNNQLATDEAGNQLYDTLVYQDTEPVDSDSFMQVYLRLMNLKAAGRLPEGFAAPEDSLLRRYQFVLLDGSQRELALFPYDPLHVAMRINGVFFDYIPKSEMEAVDFFAIKK